MQTYTVEDYEKLSGEDRWELIKGVFHMFMSPSPIRKHQRISSGLGTEILNKVRKKKYELYYAPFDVELDKDTVVQPDILLICDLNKLSEKRCVGSPELIVEILSKSSVQRDAVEKFNLYQEYGVKEYWIVYPDEELVYVYTLINGGYGEPVVYNKHQEIVLSVDADIVIDLSEVFV